MKTFIFALPYWYWIILGSLLMLLALVSSLVK
jgi:hypothetical protein